MSLLSTGISESIVEQAKLQLCDRIIDPLDVEMPLPVGRTEMQAFMDDLISLAGNYADKTSMEFAIASILIHAPADKGSLSKRYFLERLRKSAANQVASQVFQDIKQKQQEAQASAEAKVVEDTTPKVVSDAAEG